MLGRIVGVLVGLAMMAVAFGLWRPDLLPHGVQFSPDLDPFAIYKPEVCGLLGACGAVVAIAALQRSRATRARGPVSGANAEGPADPPAGAAGLGGAAAIPLEPHAQAVAYHADPAGPETPWFLSAEAPTPPAESALLVAPESADRDGFLAATEAGDHFRMQGAFDDAMDHYVVALAHARAEHAALGEDPRTQADLAAALTNVADVHDEQGRLDLSLQAHEESLTIRRHLAAAAPTDRAALRGLSLGLERLADAREARGHRARALDLYRESLPIAERLAAEHPGDPVLANDLKVTRANVAALEAKLA